jgi:phosphoribosylformylglycinamidine (FGAM) synthase-like amidotransferase family enzyme
MSAEAYPCNLNASPEGVLGVRATDGKMLGLMPHLELTVFG